MTTKNWKVQGKNRWAWQVRGGQKSFKIVGRYLWTFPYWNHQTTFKGSKYFCLFLFLSICFPSVNKIRLDRTQRVFKCPNKYCPTYAGQQYAQCQTFRITPTILRNYSIDDVTRLRYVLKINSHIILTTASYQDKNCQMRQNKDWPLEKEAKVYQKIYQ